MSHPTPIPPQRTSLPFGPKPPSGVTALLRRFSAPSPYTGGSIVIVEEPAAQPGVSLTEPPVRAEDASLHSTVPFNTVHQYNLQSRGRDYAFIILRSHAANARDPPLLYLGEELTGSVVLSLNDLSGMQSMDVVLQMFESDPIRPSFETKRILLSQQVDQSHISGGIFRWPFAIAFPTASVSSSSSSTTSSSLGHQSLHANGAGSDPKFQLVVTIYRHGRLTRNVGLRQKIYYVPPPDPSDPSSPPSTLDVLPHDHPVDTSWPEQKLPAVLVSGVMFGQVHVEVECRFIVPKSYSAQSSVIPLRLVLTGENRQALDLLAVPHVVDVRLLKVMDFGTEGATLRPFTLKNRSSFHRTDLVARAEWVLDGHAKELLPNERHPRSRWRIKLTGALHKEPGVELSASFEEPGVALRIMYIACLFPFRSTRDFKPANDPKKELAMGKIHLTN
ncbi:hypothetical protein F5148DRAFT_693119 [Russula earlei]|uniref:Uncharacterized protein n=1 Tax=Russula earlei TaxID=71964 RepID=A0ACC0UFH2_9AGAM|nr:hypothetical protein F5148DRAFT_693119 [Russula earlei]